MNIKSRLDREKLFDLYYSMGKDRSLKAVSEKSGRAFSTLKIWSSEDGWVERVEQRDIENARKLQQKTDETVIDTKAGYRKLIKAAIKKLLVKDKDGTVILSPAFEVKSPHDLETLIKLDLLLMGEATERKEGEPAIAVYIPDNGRDLVSKPRQ